MAKRRVGYCVREGAVRKKNVKGNAEGIPGVAYVYGLSAWNDKDV